MTYVDPSGKSKNEISLKNLGPMSILQKSISKSANPMKKHSPRTLRRVRPIVAAPGSAGSRQRSGEADPRSLSFGGRLDFEKVTLRESEHARDDVGREHLNLVVEEQDLVVVVLPGE